MTINIDDFSIMDHWPPRSFKRCYQKNFYHSQAYLQNQPQAHAYNFFLTVPESSQILAEIHFHQEDEHAISQLLAPFGSFIGGLLSKETAKYFLSGILKFLRTRGIKRISIYHPSSCYNPNPIWEEVLLEFGFDGKSTINHHLVVDDNPLRDKLHKMEKRKLAKCGDFVFSIQPNDQLRTIYNFILDCRVRKNQALSLSFERLETVVNNASDHFLLCAVSDGKMMAAASIIIKVNSKTWYQFYPAHHQSFDKQSPLVFLISELYRYARHQGIEVIDLGTSELNDKPLDGLLKFKKRLGGISTPKTLYYKSLGN